MNAADRRLPLVPGAGSLDQVLAWRRGAPVTVRQFIADALQAASRLPDRGHVLNACTDRYSFTVGFAAALLRGQVSVLPPNQTAEMVAQLGRSFPDLYCLADDPSLRIGLPVVALPARAADPCRVDTMPSIPADRVAAEVLTSGSTGTPRAHVKRWRELVHGTLAAAAGHAIALDRTTLEGLTVVATVPPQHMYGLESSVLLSLCAGASIDSGRPFYPQDIADALARQVDGRILVTTPFHLRALLDSGVVLPPIDLILCATAPLPIELAVRAEQQTGAPLIEIYGCTEAGQVASRRPARAAAWTTMGALAVTMKPAAAADAGRDDAAGYVVSGGHLDAPVELSDRLELETPHRFHLGGRGADLVNIAGKRASLAQLAFQLHAIDGIQDGLFHLVEVEPGGVDRLIAIVVAPTLSGAEIVEALRPRIDSVFLPRRVFKVDALPRNATGKLPSAWVAELVARLMHRDFASDAK
ncbi:xanthomonadin biosynthesis 3-hydroxybenozate--AMP ligase XanA2 [soil metagenome]